MNLSLGFYQKGKVSVQKHTFIAVRKELDLK